MERKGLTTAFCRNATQGSYFDNGRLGLYLRVHATGSKQWVQRLRIHKRRVEVGLGSFRFVSLAEARALAFENAKLAKSGLDPRPGRNNEVPLFEEAMEAVIANHAKAWKNPKSADQWRSTLKTYAGSLQKRPVDGITPADVVDCIIEQWETKQETMKRVRQRLSAIFKYCIAKGYRNDDPAGPAISEALPRTKNGRKHMKALPHGAVVNAIQAVRESESTETVKLAFEFLVLTACRSGEVRFARWDEIDAGKAVWTIPAERMKAGKEHRVPLSRQAVSVLEQAKELHDGSGLVFPSVTGKVLSDSTLSKMLRDLKVKAVPHGFRSSFRNWCAETNVNKEIAEACLAHTIKNATEAAYLRTDILDLRREVMEAWADYNER